VGDPPRIGRLLEGAIGSGGPERSIHSARLFHSWRSIVGAEVADRCTPTSLKAGVLRVKVTTPAWATELRYLAPEMIKRVNASLGGVVVKQVKPWVGREEAGSEAPKRPTKKPPAEPLSIPSETDIKMARDLVASIPDEALAKATEKALLAGKMRRRQRG